MSIKRERIGDVFVVQPGERLDVGTATEFEEAVQEVLDGGVRNVVLDLSRVTYISSVGLGTCLKCAKLAQAKQGRIVVSGLTEPVRKVFEMSGLTNLFSIYDGYEQALDSFDASASATVAAPVGIDPLTLPEEILLLALRDGDGSFVDLPEHSLDFALAGAVVMELAMRRRIDSDAESVTVVDGTVLGDPILDPALSAIHRAREGHDTQWWIETLSHEAETIRGHALERLIDRGILKRDQQKLRWVFGKRRYPVVKDAQQREVKERILAIITTDEIPEPHDVVLIALADACAVFDAIIDPDTMLELRPRITEIARMDLMAQSMRQALVATQARDRREGDVPNEPAVRERIYDGQTDRVATS